MEAMESKTNKRKTHFDRITLKDDALAKVDGWLSQIRNSSHGIKISRADIVNWLIAGHPADLTGQEQKDISDTFYDDVAFVAWAYRQIKEARKRNEKLSLAEVIARAKGGAAKTVK